MLICIHCPNIAHAVRNGIALCVPHYREAQQIITREEPCYANCEYCTTCIPMRDTPIYAQLKAERETVSIEIHVDTTAFVASLKPLLKNRKARR